MAWLGKLVVLISFLGLGACAGGGAVQLTEIMQETEDGWFDLTLTITDVMPDENGYTSVLARGLFRGEKVGIKVSYRTDMKPGIVGTEIDRTAISKRGIVFSSIGLESDGLVGAVAQLYGVGDVTWRHVEQVAVTAFALEGNPKNIRKEPVKFKVFFHDDAGDDQYAEMYTNIDLPRKKLMLLEKREEYRENILKALSKNKP